MLLFSHVSSLACLQPSLECLAVLTEASLMCRFYCEEALTVPAYPLSPLPLYCIPEASTLQGFKVGLTI